MRRSARYVGGWRPEDYRSDGGLNIMQRTTGIFIHGENVMEKPVRDAPTICLDFDGVIHSYTSGWQGPTTIPDKVTDGFFDWLWRANDLFKIVVYSSRSSEPGAIDAMKQWLHAELNDWLNRDADNYDHDIVVKVRAAVTELTFSDKKPAAFLTIDDRCVRFDGDWFREELGPKRLRDFQPWMKRDAQ